MLTNQDIRSFHRTAVLGSVDIVDKIRPGELRRPTPCDGWNLTQLLAHMTVQHRGFAAAARGNGADLAQWDAATVADAVASDPAATYAAAAADVLAAFVVHGWDVARALGAPFVLPDEVISAVLPLVFAVPDGDFRTAPESPFARAIDAGQGVSDLERALLHLGRSPLWMPSA